METSRGTSREHRGRFWVRHQHDEVRVIESNERPDSEDVDGERKVRVQGPFNNKADADAAADALFKRTFAYMRGEKRS